MKCPHCGKEIKTYRPCIVSTRSDYNLTKYDLHAIKDRHALHALIESLEGTTSRIISIVHCSIAEYNELRKGFMHPDFIEE